VVLDHGYMQGLHAPGEKTGFGTLLQIGHHILLAHGRAVQVIRSRAKAAPKVGWAPVGSLIIPATEKPADVECCRKGSFDVNPAVKNVWNCAWWADPVYLGSYPKAAFEGYGADAPTVMQGDMETICQPMDFFGANIYTASSFVCGPDGKPQRVAHPAGVALNTYEWPVTPEALYWAGRFYHDRYKKPVVITENGVCITDMVFRDGKVHDPQRCEFLDTYLSGVKRALAEGVPFAGYFYWSLMDNFEWQWGYKHRFGLVHVDFTTQKRTLKDSAFHYRDIIASGGAILHAAG